MRWVVVVGVLVMGCSTMGPEEARADVVGGAWVVQLSSGGVCFQQDLYAAPAMDESREAIAACKARLAR